jgi:hypothetical protein
VSKLVAEDQGVQRFATPRLLVQQPHSGQSLVNEILGLGLRVEDADLEVTRRLLGGLSLDEVLDLRADPHAVVRAWGEPMGAMSTREHVGTVPSFVATAALANVFVHHGCSVGPALTMRGWRLHRELDQGAERRQAAGRGRGRRGPTGGRLDQEHSVIPGSSPACRDH